MTCDLRQFREVWFVDFEYYPGVGLANGARAGDRITPLCCVAYEMRTRRTVKLWQDEFGPFPPYRLDAESLFVSYMLSADFGAHLALGWGQPACAFDPCVEFRHHTNDAKIRSGDRPKGFYSLDGALRYFGADGIDTAHKSEMRDRIIAGPPFTLAERREITSYCGDDVMALARLFRHIIPTVRSLPHAMQRAKFMWATAQQERRGVPLDLPLYNRICNRWKDIKLDLVTEVDKPFGCYEIVKGEPHWRKDWFKNLVRRHRLPWPTLASGMLDEDDDTFKDMAKAYPQLEPLRELRSSLSKLRLSGLQIGSDGRNRTLLSPYGSKTGRNQPSTTSFIFGPAKWFRFLIAPPPGRALIYRDYCQQEMHIAAVLSGDGELLAACESGDVYLGVAKQLGQAPKDATSKTHGALRNLFKTVVLGINYGLGARSLAMRTGVSPYEAAEILARLRARFRVFEAYAANVIDHAGLDLELSTPFGWRMRCSSGVNYRTLRNFPMQSTGAEILHVACVLAERRGIEIVAPIHDALLSEAPVRDLEDASIALGQVMSDASAVVLKGYRLRTDVKVIRPGEHFHDDRGVKMWTTVTNLVAKFEENAA
jgi:DNA polymerase family A